MLAVSLLLPWILVFFPAWAQAQKSNSSSCETVQSGNLSPNKLSGNFGLFKGVLGFDPTNIVTPFDVALQACPAQPAVPGATSPGTLRAPTGECLAGKNATTTQGPTIVTADCSLSGSRSDMTWAVSKDLIYWVGQISSACSTGLYGYKSISSSGAPTAVQKGLVNLGCSSESGVFGFGVLG